MDHRYQDLILIYQAVRQKLKIQRIHQLILPYSDIQNVKAKYGSNAGIYRNTGNGTPINTSETSNVQKSMAQNMVSIQSSQLKLEKQIHSMLE